MNQEVETAVRLAARMANYWKKNYTNLTRIFNIISSIFSIPDVEPNLFTSYYDIIKSSTNNITCHFVIKLLFSFA